MKSLYLVLAVILILQQVDSRKRKLKNKRKMKKRAKSQGDFTDVPVHYFYINDCMF